MKLIDKNILRALNTQRRRAMENTVHTLPMEYTNVGTVEKPCISSRRDERKPARKQ